MKEADEKQRLKPGWYAASVNYLIGYLWRSAKHDYSYFDHLQQVAKAEKSIYIYHLSNSDIELILRNIRQEQDKSKKS